MKVLRIIPSMDPSSGGPCQGIRNIIPSLQKAGIYNEVVCMDDPSASFLQKDSFTIQAIGPARGPWQYCPQLIPWLLNNLERFDVVIIHALWLYHGYAAKKALNIYKKSVVKGSKKKLPKLYVMPHGMLDPYFQRAGERKLKALRNQVYWKLIEHKVVNEADGVLFTCEAELLLAREPFRPYHPRKEISIGYGVEKPPSLNPAMQKAFREKCPEINGDRFILFLSRIHEKKGIDHLIEAYSNLMNAAQKSASANSSIMPKLIIAGPGLDSDYGKKLQSMVAAFPDLLNHVLFPGMLTGNEKWGAFYECEAFILPSHQENFGIAVAEALACGKPVLITYQVNIWREILEGGAGIVADDTTDGAELLLESWKRLSPESKQQMSEKALDCFEKEFAIGPAADRFCNLIASQTQISPARQIS